MKNITIPEALIIETMQGVIDNFLKPKFLSLGMNATGKWLDSLEPKSKDGVGQIWGLDYSEFLAKGRKPGQPPPIAPLIPWVNAKLGIRGKQALGVAIAVSKKIEKEGTDYYPKGTDLLEVLETKEVVNFINDELKKEVTAQITEQLKRQINGNLS